MGPLAYGNAEVTRIRLDDFGMDQDYAMFFVIREDTAFRRFAYSGIAKCASKTMVIKNTKAQSVRSYLLFY